MANCVEGVKVAILVTEQVDLLDPRKALNG